MLQPSGLQLHKRKKLIFSVSGNHQSLLKDTQYIVLINRLLFHLNHLLHPFLKPIVHLAKQDIHSVIPQFQHNPVEMETPGRCRLA